MEETDRMRLFRIVALFIIISVSAVGAEQPPQGGVGTLSGKIMVNEKQPMKNGMVLLYNPYLGPPPHPYKYWRIPDMIISTEQNGSFSIDLPEGAYYMMIAQKSPDGEIGPPGKDEFLYFHSDKEGNAAPVSIQAGKKLDLGTLTTAFFWMADKVEREKGVTSASGVVSDDAGKPVKNVVVFAYLYSEATGRPAFVSDRTDKDGKFIIRFYEGGTYFLKVRGVIGGGKPRAGEFMNVTKEFEPTMISLKKDEKLKDVKLQVKMFTTPVEQAPSPLEKDDKFWRQLRELQSEQ
jgi:hypothetical protein